ncbi:PREDICTED: uncharacterized protein LOC105363192 [Ceratosolen solmsi marchali]|uniref:Uncharacterized protein LOC105363192 n=1 Tax=Ceratosolen solmsi marchali TaxID=326594 RepID=A0AAJ6YJB0_9HYME|nr:PREDICTED: uncharacterized protein LOC105363192 [Ceratosolen solmsi marchali]
MGKTRGVHETTPEIRNRMVGMYEAGLGLREIAAAVNCSQRTVKRWLNRFDKEGTVETRDRCGRKRATTQEQDEAIIRLATQTPITAAKAVLPALGLNCSVDTIRERLHKAGIHNWSPSRKHIQKMPIAVADGAGIQQAVWRPTGTQLGKKKLSKEVATVKTNNSQSKKKVVPRKAKSKQAFNTNVESNDTTQQTEVQSSFAFSSPQQSVPAQAQLNEMQPLPPPPPPPLPHPVISTNPSQYSHSLNLLPQSQPIYHHHPGLNVSQNWPIDLVQGAHHYTQNHQNSIHHEQHQPVHIQTHSQLHNHHDAQLNQHMQDQIPPSMHSQHHDISQQKVDHQQIEHHQDLTKVSQGKLNEPQDVIINVCSDACSNSNNSSNENSQNSSVDDELSSDNNCTTTKKRKSGRLRRKKGGKIKGTLETSIEIRNRMIGMSEAGLSTLSIALAINRSERTVKRWLDRWHKEGNVQTKERKGRRRITTKEQDDAIIAMATQHPLTAAKYVAPALGLKCSVDTIRERLHKAGIHSWKLGKKQGEGNTVHTVHLWQPSGNRSNKVKIIGEKKKKSPSKKRNKHSEDSSKQFNKKQRVETSPLKIVAPSTNILPEETNLQYQSHSQSPAMMQSAHDMQSTSAVLIHPQEHTQVPPVCSQGPPQSQALQAMGSMIQQRPDCRLALSAIVPPIPTQPSNNIAYPSCMMGSSSHTGHMEQTDPMNYEPYIWTF